MLLFRGMGKAFSAVDGGVSSVVSFLSVSFSSIVCEKR